MIHLNNHLIGCILKVVDNIPQNNQQQPVVNGNIVNNLQNAANQVGGNIQNAANQLAGNLQHMAKNMGAGEVGGFIKSLEDKVNELSQKDKVIVQMDQNKSQQEKEKEKAQELEKKNKLIDEQQQQHQVLPPNRNGNEDDDKEEHECDSTCLGLRPEELGSEPKDKHLFRLANLIDINECTRFFEKLGLSSNTWNKMKSQYRHEPTASKFFALCQWKGQKKKKDLKRSFQELSHALSAGGYTVHLLCKVFKEDKTVYENENTTLQKSPGDDVLKVLSTKLGDCAIQLGVELGLPVAEITETLKKSGNCTFKETLDVMTKWKKSSQNDTHADESSSFG